MTKIVSIVIPLYNKEKSIRATLESICAQSYTDWECIVVNDGSTDKSHEVAEQVGIEDKRFRIISQPNKGVSAARNRGIKEAKNELVALIDGDDLWDKDCLKELVRMTEDFPKAALWGVNYSDKIGDRIYPYNQGVPDGFRGYFENYYTTRHRDIFCSSSVILRREVAIEAGLFDERMKYAEDLDFWYRMMNQAPVAFYNEAYAYYNKGAENRAEQDRSAHYDIYKRQEYYIDKYVADFKRLPDFARYLGMRVAQNILLEGYYFGDQYDQEATNHIIKYLPYNVLPFKYTLIFKTPRWIGKLMFHLSWRIKELKNRRK